MKHCFLRCCFVIWAITFITGIELASLERLIPIRLGTVYGGWTLPVNLLFDQSICYSVGVGEDISFDIELIRRIGCKVFLFDPTPRSIAHIDYVKKNIQEGKPAYINNSKEQYFLNVDQLTNIIFYPYGFWHKDEIITFFAPKDPSHVSYSIVNLQHTNQTFDAQCKKISSIMKDLGHDHIDLLKMDIEGAEYAVLHNMLEEAIYPRILCVELHAVEKGIEQRMVEVLQSKGYRLFYQNGATDFTFIKN